MDPWERHRPAPVTRRTGRGQVRLGPGSADRRPRLGIHGSTHGARPAVDHRGGAEDHVPSHGARGTFDAAGHLDAAAEGDRITFDGAGDICVAAH